MKIQTNQGQTRQEIAVAPNLVRDRVFLDANGNEINPRTKEILTPKEQ